MRTFLHRMTLNVCVVGEMLQFLWSRRLWWLIPMVATLLLIALLMVFASTSGVGPLIYALW